MYFMLRLDFVRMRGIIARILVVGGSKLANGGDCVSECEFFTTDGVTQAFSNSTALVGLQQPRRGANLLTMSGHGRLNHFILAGGSCGSETLNSIELMKCKSTSDGNFQWSEKWRMSKWKLRERRSCGMGVRFNDVFLLLGGYDGLECLKSVESHGITDLIEGKEQCEDVRWIQLHHSLFTLIRVHFGFRILNVSEILSARSKMELLSLSLIWMELTNLYLSSVDGMVEKLSTLFLRCLNSFS